MDIQSDNSKKWQLWQEGEMLRELPADLRIRPALTSWMASDHPDQIKLNAYRDLLYEHLGEFQDRNLYIRLDIEVEAKNLLRHHDVENYLKPVIDHFGHDHFVLATVTKQIGSTPNVKSLRIGYAVPRSNALNEGWHSFTHYANTGAQKKPWKEGIRDALKKQGVVELDNSEDKREVEVILAWRGAPNRNWASLWKPTGDAMGPILGEPRKDKPFSPNDDCITYLECHWLPDASLEYEVSIGMWWRSKP